MILFNLSSYTILLAIIDVFFFAVDSESTIRRIVKESETHEGKFETPGKIKKGRTPKVIDSFDISAIRHKIGEGILSKLARLSLISVKMSTTPSPTFRTSNPLNKKLSGIRVDVMKVEDTTEVLQYLRKNFFKDEPLCAAIRLLESENDRCKPLEDYSLKDISQGVSVKAINGGGRIIGVVLGAVINRHQSKQDSEDWSVGCDHPKFKKILHFLYQCEKACDIFGIYPDIDSLAELKIISVEKSYRGQAVGRMLSAKFLEIAHKSKLDLAKFACTSEYSSKLADRFGSVENFSVRYEDYKINGEQVFHIEPPHTTFRIKSLRLDKLFAKSNIKTP